MARLPCFATGCPAAARTKSGSGGDIEGSHAVTAGAAGIGNRLADRHRYRSVAHDGEASRDLVGRFAFGAERGDKCAELCRRAGRFHDLGHCRGRFVTA